MKKTLFILISLVLSIGFAVAEDMPAGYYDAVNGTKDGKLKGTLKLIIRDHTVIPYGDDTWEVFYYSDQDENGYTRLSRTEMIRGRYSITVTRMRTATAWICTAKTGRSSEHRVRLCQGVT